MIGYLKGKIQRTEKGAVVIVCGGVGYVVNINNQLLPRLKIGEEKELLIQTVVREDAINLYGFEEREELKMFTLLTSVTGVGPKTALNLLSGATVTEISEGIVNGDLAILTATPGIGKKNASRIIIELRGKLGGGESAEMSDINKDVEQVLLNWSFSKGEIREVLKSVERNLPTEEQIRIALKSLSRK